MLKNRIIRKDRDYYLITKDGQEFICKLYQSDLGESWQVRLPDNNPTGRTFVPKKVVDTFYHGYEFEEKDMILSNDWREKLTEREKIEVEIMELTLDRIKVRASQRIVYEVGSKEWLEKEIEKLTKRLENK